MDFSLCVNLSVWAFVCVGICPVDLCHVIIFLRVKMYHKEEKDCTNKIWGKERYLFNIVYSKKNIYNIHSHNERDNGRLYLIQCFNQLKHTLANSQNTRRLL